MVEKGQEQPLLDKRYCKINVSMCVVSVVLSVRFSNLQMTCNSCILVFHIRQVIAGTYVLML